MLAKHNLSLQTTREQRYVVFVIIKAVTEVQSNLELITISKIGILFATFRLRRAAHINLGCFAAALTAWAHRYLGYFLSFRLVFDSIKPK